MVELHQAMSDAADRQAGPQIDIQLTLNHFWEDFARMCSHLVSFMTGKSTPPENVNKTMLFMEAFSTKLLALIGLSRDKMKKPFLDLFESAYHLANASLKRVQNTLGLSVSEAAG